MVLRLLYEKPSYGYQLIEMLEEKSSGLHRLETGSIYTVLRRMERRGLLRSEWEEAEAKPDRRIYKVTKSGMEALKSGLQTIAKRKVLMDDLAKFYEKNFQRAGRR